MPIPFISLSSAFCNVSFFKPLLYDFFVLKLLHPVVFWSSQHNGFLPHWQVYSPSPFICLLLNMNILFVDVFFLLSLPTRYDNVACVITYAVWQSYSSNRKQASVCNNEHARSKVNSLKYETPQDKKPQENKTSLQLLRGNFDFQ